MSGQPGARTCAARPSRVHSGAKKIKDGRHLSSNNCAVSVPLAVALCPGRCRSHPALMASADGLDPTIAQANARLGTWLKNKYLLDHVLGVGGMATVYAATHRNQAELAVKVLHAELSVREQVRTRFCAKGMSPTP